MNYPEDIANAFEILNKFGINQSANKDLTFEKWNCVTSIYMPIFESVIIEIIEKLKMKFLEGNLHKHIDLFNAYLANYKI